MNKKTNISMKLSVVCLSVLMVAMLISFSVFAAENNILDSGDCGDQGGNVTWTLYDNGELVISGAGAMADFATASTPWYPYSAFITECIVEDGVTSIGSCAFPYCTELKSITIGEDVVSIGSSAFAACISLEKIVIPENVENIGYSAFTCCLGLEQVEWNAKNVQVSDGFIFSFDKDDIDFIRGIISIPEDIDIAGFSVVFGETVETIPKNLFEYCYNIRSAYVNGNVKEIGELSFAYSSLENIVINGNVDRIGDNAFFCCMNLKNAAFNGTVRSIGERAFSNCLSLEQINLPDGLSEIGDSVFLYCAMLPEITIPETVMSIGVDAFRSCTNLTGITISKNVEAVGKGAFACCELLTDITVEGNPDISESYIGTTILDRNEITEEEIKHYFDIYWSAQVVLYNYSYGFANISESELNALVAEYNEAKDWINSHTSSEELVNPNAVIHCCKASWAAYTAKEQGIRCEYFDGDFGHTVTLHDGASLDATCTQAGYAYYDCPICGEYSYYEYEEPLGHSYGEWTVTQEPTYFRFGEKEKVCSRCGDTLTEEIEPIDPAHEVMDEATGVGIVYADGVYSEEIELVVTRQTDGDLYNLLLADNDESAFVLYDITTTAGGEKVQPDGLVGVGIPLPEGFSGENCAVYYIAEDGTKQKLDCICENGYILFETTHFSAYAVVDESEKAPCTHICHSDSKFLQFFYKLARFFWKLFGMESKRYCECGMAHW